MDKKKMRANLMLLLTALIWGSAFVAQKSGMEYVGPFTFNGVRFMVATIVLLPVIYLMGRINAKNSATENAVTAEKKAAQRKTLIIGGICCGICLFIASSLQQIGLIYTTAGKGGFITALYIVLVPILGLFLRRKVRKLVWLCVAIAAVGLYLLCMPAGGFDINGLNKGDLIMLLCAVCFSFHILIIDHFSPKTDGVKLSCIQFFVCSLISLIPMFAFETISLSVLMDCAVPILYTGVLSSGVGYTLQVVAQKDTDPTIASLLMSLESVFSVIAGVIILHEVMAGREIMGCVLMFAAIIMAQLPAKEKN